MNIQRSIEKASIELLLEQPFFATLLLSLDLKITEAIPRAATDGKELLINPVFWSSLSFKDQLFILAHEVMHPAMLHHTRRNGRDPETWNKACDYAINLILKEAKFSIPAWVLYDEQYENMSADQIYTMLEEEQREEQQQGGSGGGQGDEDEEQEQEQPTPSDEDGNEEQEQEQPTPSDEDGNEEQEDEQETEGDDEEGDEDEGTGSGSADSDEEGEGEAGWEPGDGFEGSAGDVKDYPGESPEEVVEHEATMTERVQQAYNAAEKVGKGPGGIEDMLEDLRNPKVYWADHLRRLLSEKARDDYNRARPNRRYLGTGFILPSLYNETYGEITLIIDTSGSLSLEDLNEIATEVHGIHDFAQSKVRVIYCDHEVQKVDEFEGTDDLVLESKGGGGTSFVPPFEWMEANDVEPKVSIYFTDGYCWDFPEEPDHDVIWCVSVPERRSSFDPPFGDVIHFKN